MAKAQQVKIKRRIREKDYEASYNGVKGYGESAVMAFRNAKRNYEIDEQSKQLQIINANFKETLENVRS